MLEEVVEAIVDVQSTVTQNLIQVDWLLMDVIQDLLVDVVRNSQAVVIAQEWIVFAGT